MGLHFRGTSQYVENGKGPSFRAARRVLRFPSRSDVGTRNSTCAIAKSMAGPGTLTFSVMFTTIQDIYSPDETETQRGSIDPSG